MFPQTRKIRGQKAAVQSAYAQVLEKNQCDEDLLLNALKKDIEDRKSRSLLKNNLSFMKSPLNWLKEQVFLDFEDSDEEEESIKLDNEFN